MKTSNIIQLDAPARSEQFALLAERLHKLLSAEGYRNLPYKDRSNLYFSQLPEAQQITQLNHFNTYVEVCEDTVKEGHSLRESGFLLWNMLKKLNLRSSSDIFSDLKHDQIVEIYDNENVQIFRNLSFFNVCSYSFDELHSIPWWKLYRRDDSVNREIFQYGIQVFNGELKQAVTPQIPIHLLEELESTSMLKMLVNIKTFAPLTGANNSRHIFVIEEAQLIEN